MRAQVDSTFSDSKSEEGGGPAKSLVGVNSDSGVPQNEQNDFLESLAPLPNKKVPKSQGHTLEDTKPIVSDVTESRVQGAVGPAWKYALHILVVCLGLAYIYDTIVDVPCRLPVLPQYFPHCTGESDRPIVAADFVTLVQFQSRLGQVMEDTTHSSKIAVDIKDSEMALRDLRTLVTYSTLSNKDTLGRNLKHFVDDAKATSGSLQQFGSRVWGAVDRIVSLNEHTLIMLENTPTGRELATNHQDRLESIWLQGIELLNGTLHKLIHEAEANVVALQRLGEKLNNIEDMVSAEKHEISKQEQKLKRQWFRERLGLNEEQRQSHGASLELLTTVGGDRMRALNHVTGALLKLKQMSDHLDDLRDRVATPMIVTASNIPVEAHIRNIRSGTEQLVDGQARMREIEDEYRRRKFASD